jgi:HlyD family secretion protein
MNDQAAPRDQNTLANEPESRNGPLSLSDRVRSLRLPERNPAERSALWWLPWVLCGVLAVATAYFAWRSLGGIPADSKDGAASANATAKAPPTPSAADRLAPGEIVQESKGWIVPAVRILVSPEVEGKIKRLHIKYEGMAVKKDALLAELEDDKYKADFDEARGMKEAAWQRYLEQLAGYRPEEIQQAKAELEEMEAQRDQLYQDFKRNSALKTSMALAPREFEQAQSSFLAMERRVERLRLAHKLMVDGPRAEKLDAHWAEYESARGKYDRAKWYFSNTVVRAPISGTILTKQAEEGSKVSPQPFSNDKGISSSLCELADLTRLEVDLPIAERDIARIFKDQKCKIRAEAFPNRVYDGAVSRLMPIADRARASVIVRVSIRMRDEQGNFVFHDEAEGRFLRPEMGAIVTFLK